MINKNIDINKKLQPNKEKLLFKSIIWLKSVSVFMFK